jgi:hypothetical protein
VDDAAARAAEALAALTELSSEIRAAALVDADGAVLASTGGAHGGLLARTGTQLLDAAAGTAAAGAAVEHVDVSLPAGSVIALRDEGRVAVATTGPKPATALVLHDLRTCLRRLAEVERPRRGRRQPAGEAADA